MSGLLINPANGITVSQATKADLDALTNFLVTKYNYNPGAYEGYSYGSKSQRLSTKIDWNINNKNTFTLKYNYLRSSSDIAASNSMFTVPARKSASIYGHIIGAINYFVELVANDYVEIVWRTESTTVSLEQTPAESSPTRPATPSVIATMQLSLIHI